jgi:hypothetical protein
MDAVIVSWAKNETFLRMTQNAIDTALASGVKSVVVVESEPNVTYDNAETIPYAGEFNYNRALNMGIEECSDYYIALCNNDLIFHAGFAEIERIMSARSIHSASPCHPKEDIMQATRMGYGIKKELRGWCIVLDRYVLERIGKLDETYTFHYSDNAYADQLKKENVEHHLINGVYVEHLVSKTLNTIPVEERKVFTREQKQKYGKINGRGVHISPRAERRHRSSFLIEESRRCGAREGIRRRGQA